MADTPNLKLTELATNQVNPENFINDNYKVLDAIIQLTVVSQALSTPPGSPSNGDRYIPAATATGDWTGEENNIAYYYNGWHFITPVVGWVCYDQNNSAYYEWTGSSWVLIEGYLKLSSEKTAAYEVVEADAGTVIVCNSGSAFTVTLDDTITTLGFSVRIVNRGAGTVTVAAEGSDTLESSSSTISQYGSVLAIRIASTVWALY